MHLLITAGNTQAPIDRVRCLTNLFTGRTGAGIAYYAWGRGHRITLLTSHPEGLEHFQIHGSRPGGERWAVHPYRTFDELNRLMGETISSSRLDGVIHSAAVSDYLSAGVYSLAPGTHFLESGEWKAEGSSPPALLDRAAAKVKSGEPELWLRLVRAPKLVDRIRREWGFGGVLVKFKLEVGIGEEQLLSIAENSRCQSAADLMVANTLEGAASWAFLGAHIGHYQRVSRGDLPAKLLEAVEVLHEKKCHG